MKTPDMSVFVGKSFDCEGFLNPSETTIIPELTRDHFCEVPPFTYIRPRLNQKQVLDDYSWLPDGFVFNARVCFFAKGSNATGSWHHATHRQEVLTSTDIKRVVEFDHYLEWVECIGVTPEYAEWGESVGLPVIEPSGGS